MVGLFGSQIDSLVGKYFPCVMIINLTCWGAESATSEYLPAAQEDLSTNLEICDLIRSKQVAARDAMRSIKRRLQHGNPNVVLLALSVLYLCYLDLCGCS